MKIVKDSHVDHLPPAVLSYIIDKYANRDEEFFIDTFAMPPGVSNLESALYGPVCGDPPVEEAEVAYAPREGRAYSSRLIDRPKRSTCLCTVIGGYYKDHGCVLYTAFGGLPSPKEVNDPTLSDKDRDASVAFWSIHALAR